MDECLYDTDNFGCACSRSVHHGSPCEQRCPWYRRELSVNALTAGLWLEVSDTGNGDEGVDDDEER